MNPQQQRAIGKEMLQGARELLLVAARFLDGNDNVAHHHGLCALTDVDAGIEAVTLSEQFDAEREQLEREMERKEQP